MEKTRLLIGDEQMIMREGLRLMLNMESDMNVIGTFERNEGIQGLIKELRPDVIIMDMIFEEEIQTENIRLIKQNFPKTVILILSSVGDEEIILEALSAGVSGYFLKNMNIAALTRAIRDCMLGNISMPMSLAAKLTEKLLNLRIDLKEAEKRNLKDLSFREREIAQLMVRGLSNKKIASTFYISEGTVKNYISNIYSKIGINDRTQAVLYLREIELCYENTDA